MAKSRRGRKDPAMKTAGGGRAGGVVSLILKIIGTVLLVGITTCVMFACIFGFYIKTTMESQLEITFEDYSNQLGQTSFLYFNRTSDGSLTDEAETGAGGDSVNGTMDDDKVQYWTKIMSTTKRTWVDYEEIPQFMMDAAVAIEDKRFYEHQGVDWYRTAGAVRTMFFGQGESSYGASTITQQLIKNLTNYDDVTVKRKIIEIFRALEVESKYSKQEVITWYLNVIYLGQSSYGVQAAAQTYFNKDLDELSLAQCASIIGITKSPSIYDPYYSVEKNKERQETILYEMYDQGYITHDQYQEAINETLEFASKKVVEEGQAEYIYSYYQETVIEDAIEAIMVEHDLSTEAAKTMVYNGGLHIYTCVDPKVQNAIDTVYGDLAQIPAASGGNGQQLQSAITIQDPQTGYVVGLSGGVGPKTINFGLNRATDIPRRPGSSIKPLSVYGPALDTGVITLNSVYQDSPPLVDAGKKWPTNDNGSWSGGNKSITTAVQNSLNTIAVRVYEDLGADASYHYMTEKLGFTTIIGETDSDGNTDKNPAPLALGQLTTGVKVREITSAYCALANGGVYTKSKTFYMIYDSNQEVYLDNSSPETSVAFDLDTANTMTQLLYNAVQNGTGTAAKLASGMAVAGKTGTAGDDKDRWFCGYTPYYVASVWTGFDIEAAISVSGNPAAKLWNKVMAIAHEGLEVQNFNTGVTLNKKGDTQATESPSPSPSPAPSDEATPTTPETTTPSAESPSPSESTTPTETPPPATDTQPQEEADTQNVGLAGINTSGYIVDWLNGNYLSSGDGRRREESV